MGLTQHISPELWKREEIFTRSVAARLWECGRNDLSQPLEDCHRRETHCHCMDCGHVRKFWNRCDRFYCPMCCQALAFRRRQSVEAWANSIAQPKHLVLTARNRSTISKTYVQWFKAGLGKLRRHRHDSPWRGGLYSLEVTNEGKGWHLHAHLLVDVDWLNMADISTRWGKLVDQDYAIVACRDVRERSYLQEVTKYAVKGSELASWGGIAASTYIDAMSGVRQFGVFGSLFKDRILRQTIAEELKPEACTCPECDSTRLRYLDDNEEEWLQTTGQWPKLPFYALP